MYACAGGHEDIVQVLLDAGAQVRLIIEMFRLSIFFYLRKKSLLPHGSFAIPGDNGRTRLDTVA